MNIRRNKIYVYDITSYEMSHRRNVSACGSVHNIRMSYTCFFYYISSEHRPRTCPCLEGGNTSHHVQLSWLRDINALYMAMSYSEAYPPLLALDRITRCMSSRQHACCVFQASSVPRHAVFYGRACRHDAVPARSLNLRLGNDNELGCMSSGDTDLWTALTFIFTFIYLYNE
jgi:hypothetical protein